MKPVEDFYSIKTFIYIVLVIIFFQLNIYILVWSIYHPIEWKHWS